MLLRMERSAGFGRGLCDPGSRRGGGEASEQCGWPVGRLKLMDRLRNFASRSFHSAQNHKFGYFCATNARAWLSSGRVEFEPSQTFNSSA
jgi:hypothetical protein